ncbi:hypothetical protein GCM10011390_26580 [Aureimonas endophytica]|uniref:Uncharacterized protein n=1 Tax=Aureimonas endophytica TaxID=2027858 RepID=A0A917E5D9_9HYPH|nr:hypothetical protein GCM10011390_26580 [Aureimonas endophytica]
MSEQTLDRSALPLFCVKVADFGQSIAGPAVAMILRDRRACRSPDRAAPE